MLIIINDSNKINKKMHSNVTIINDWNKINKNMRSNVIIINDSNKINKTVFCDYHEQRDSLSMSTHPYFKSFKNGLMKNGHLRLANIFVAFNYFFLNVKYTFM